MCDGCFCSIGRNEVKGQGHIHNKSGQKSTGAGFSDAGLLVGNVAAYLLTSDFVLQRLCTKRAEHDFYHNVASTGNVAVSRPARHHGFYSLQKTAQNVLFCFTLNVLLTSVMTLAMLLCRRCT